MPTPLRFDMILTNGEPLRWDMGPEFRWDGDVPESLTNPPNNMSLPNVAVPFPPATRVAIADGIVVVKDLFPVLGPVSPEERKELQKVGPGRQPVITEAFTDAQAHPNTVPGTVNMTTWALLEAQYEGLDQSESLLASLLEQVRGVKAVVGDLRYKNVRKYYDYMDGNLDSLAGAISIHAKIAKLFEKQGPQPEGPPPVVPPGP